MIPRKVRCGDCRQVLVLNPEASGDCHVGTTNERSGHLMLTLAKEYAASGRSDSPYTCGRMPAVPPLTSAGRCRDAVNV